MALTVGTNTWLSVTDADEFFTLRLSTDSWTAAATAKKEAALAQAYRTLTQCGLYSFPDTATQAMKDAQCEQALFLLHEEDSLDARMALQAQGVRTANVVKESYGDGVATIPLAPLAKLMLDDYALSADKTAQIVTIYRDEDED